MEEIHDKFEDMHKWFGADASGVLDSFLFLKRDHVERRL